MNVLFDHEKLEVYKESLAFLAWLEPLIQELPKTIASRDQLDRASTRTVACDSGLRKAGAGSGNPVY